MDFIERTSFPVAGYYLAFFVVSFLILALILLSGLPVAFRKLIHAIRLIRARRSRTVRMLANRELLDEAGETLVGMTFFGDKDGNPTAD